MLCGKTKLPGYRVPLQVGRVVHARSLEFWESQGSVWQTLLADLDKFPAVGIGQCSPEFITSHGLVACEVNEPAHAVFHNLAEKRLTAVMLSTFAGNTFILRTCFFYCLPPSFVNLMKNTKILKIGVTNDRERIRKDWNVSIENFLDIRHLLERKFPSTFVGCCLPTLSAILFGIAPQVNTDWTIRVIPRVIPEEKAGAAVLSMTAIDAFSALAGSLLEGFGEGLVWEKVFRYPAIQNVIYRKVAPFIGEDYACGTICNLCFVSGNYNPEKYQPTLHTAPPFLQLIPSNIQQYLPFRLLSPTNSSVDRLGMNNGVASAFGNLKHNNAGSVSSEQIFTIDGSRKHGSDVLSGCDKGNCPVQPLQCPESNAVSELDQTQPGKKIKARLRRPAASLTAVGSCESGISNGPTVKTTSEGVDNHPDPLAGFLGTQVTELVPDILVRVAGKLGQHYDQRKLIQWLLATPPSQWKECDGNQFSLR